MRFFRALLRLYPASFRGEYGEEMCAVFAHRRREASGPGAALLLWLAAIGDTIGNAAAVHADILRQDLRYTARSLRRSKGFAVTAMLVVGLGIGATTAVFSVADFVLIRPLPFPDADRLVAVWERHPGYPRMELSPANYRDFRHAATVFSSMAAFTNLSSANLTGIGEPRRLVGAEVSAELLPTLRIQPLIGRSFTPADDRPGASGTIILSYRLWQTEFGGTPDVLGRPLSLDQQPFVVIGVMPATFHYPDDETEYWTPLRPAPAVYEDRNDNYWYGVARLKDGVTLEQARAEMDVVAAQLTKQYPKENAHTGAWVNAMRDDELPWQSKLLLMALGAAALCVLLIACANLASLLLTRALARRQELAVRSAMGAGPERLVRQLTTETVLLAGAGGVLGLLVGAGAVPLLMRLVPQSLPLAQAPHLDLRVLGFAAALTLLTGVGFGTLPLLRAGGGDPGGLRDTARAGGGRRERLRGGLVVAEIVASIVLLVSAGLLLRALWRVQATDPGFRVDSVLTVRTPLPSPRYKSIAKQQNFYASVLAGVRALPGVRAAAYTTFAPMTFGGGIFPVSTDGHEREDRSGGYSASLRKVTPGFFAALDIPVTQGRDVAESDTADRQPVAVVSESFVKRFLPDGSSPVGRHFQFAFRDLTVVGVVGDIHVRGLEQESEPQVYLSYLQPPPWQFYWPRDLIVRSSVSPDALLPSIRAIVRKADPDQPIASVQTMDQIVTDKTASRSAQLRVLGAFAAIAFLLAAIGIHGVLSFAVSQRTHEIGVRMALGAQRSDILAWVMRRAVLLTGVGVVPGVALAYAAGRWLQSLLAGVTPGDAATFGSVVGLAVAMTLAGALAPAVRAVRVDPIGAIREP